MHELPVMQSVLNVILKHAVLHRVKKVHAVGLSVGTLSDLEEEWMQKYFDHLSKGTVAEGAKLRIQWVPAVLSCEACGKRFDLDKTRLDGITCPACGEKNFTLVSGREYHIRDMEAE